MFEYIQFYTKNLSNFTLLIVVGVVIAILDITFRNIIKDVYLNVRENMKQNNAGKEGLVNKNTATGSGNGSGGSGGSSDTNVCPKSCSDVEALRTKLTGLIENAARLQQDIQNNNTTIQRQQFLIQQMQKSVQKLVEKSK
jgi:hypothetical protein